MPITPDPGACANCVGGCNCVVTAGDGITVTGIGSQGDPFVVSAGAAPDRFVGYLYTAGTNISPVGAAPLISDGFTAVATIAVTREMFDNRNPNTALRFKISGDQTVLDDWTLGDLRLSVHNDDYSECIYLIGGAGEPIVNNAFLNLGTVDILNSFGTELSSDGAPITGVKSSVPGAIAPYYATIVVFLYHV